MRTLKKQRCLKPSPVTSSISHCVISPVIFAGMENWNSQTELRSLLVKLSRVYWIAVPWNASDTRTPRKCTITPTLQVNLSHGTTDVKLCTGLSWKSIPAHNLNIECTIDSTSIFQESALEPFSSSVFDQF